MQGYHAALFRDNFSFMSGMFAPQHLRERSSSARNGAPAPPIAASLVANFEHDARQLFLRLIGETEFSPVNVQKLNIFHVEIFYMGIVALAIFRSNP